MSFCSAVQAEDEDDRAPGHAEQGPPVHRPVGVAQPGPDGPVQRDGQPRDGGDHQEHADDQVDDPTECRDENDLRPEHGGDHPEEPGEQHVPQAADDRQAVGGTRPLHPRSVPGATGSAGEDDRFLVGLAGRQPGEQVVDGHRRGPGASPGPGRSPWPASRSQVASSSTPSATTSRPRCRPRSTIARTMATFSAPASRPATKLRSILTSCDREALQVGQRRVAGAEVVDRQADAEVAQLVQQARRRGSGRP